MEFCRYGVYFTPKQGQFAAAGAAWLGWDLSTGEPSVSPLPDLTERPRKYGFHATIKPPFALAAEQSPPALMQAFENFCSSHKPVLLEGLDLTSLGSFMAFTARGDITGVADLSSEAVKVLDRFRAPPSEAEVARRRQTRLTPEQEENLLRWGYPHVMGQFRFHMTLTGPVARPLRQAVSEQIEEHFRSSVPAPFPIDSLTLVGEDEDGFFHEIKRCDLCNETP